MWLKYKIVKKISKTSKFFSNVMIFQYFGRKAAQRSALPSPSRLQAGSRCGMELCVLASVCRRICSGGGGDGHGRAAAGARRRERCYGRRRSWSGSEVALAEGLGDGSGGGGGGAALQQGRDGARQPAPKTAALFPPATQPRAQDALGDAEQQVYPHRPPPPLLLLLPPLLPWPRRCR